MKVFISWSGSVSKQVAQALKDWLPSVINSIDPFISLEIDKGTRWAAEIAGELDATTCGIICITRENVGSPWLNFEAGALSKSVTGENTFVITFLYGLGNSEVPQGPLTQFQSVLFEREDVRRMLSTLNGAALAKGEGIGVGLLDRAFEKWWPDLEEALNKVQHHSQPSPRRSPEEVMDEVLEGVRALQRALPMAVVHPVQARPETRAFLRLRVVAETEEDHAAVENSLLADRRVGVMRMVPSATNESEGAIRIYEIFLHPNMTSAARLNLRRELLDGVRRLPNVRNARHIRVSLEDDPN